MSSSTTTAAASTHVIPSPTSAAHSFPPTLAQPTLASPAAPAATPASSPTTSAPAASRPRLLPQNRRLRHVKGLSLLNLSLARSPTPGLPARASDDAAVPQVRNSSHSLLSLPRSSASTHLLAPPLPSTALQHTRSSEDLRLIARSASRAGDVGGAVGSEGTEAGSESGVGDDDGAAAGRDRSDAEPVPAMATGSSSEPVKNSGKAKAKGKAVPPKTPRRWSLVVAGHGAGPRQRQAALGKAIDSKLADVFFSMHCEAREDPNFHFSPFDLSQHLPPVSRASTLKVRFWALRHNHSQATCSHASQQSVGSRSMLARPDQFSLLLEDTIFLPAMTFIPSAALPSRLPSNTILLHLIDGTYSLDLPAPPRPPSPTRRQLAEPTLTASYGALMRLTALERSIADALATQADLSLKIDKFVRPKTARGLGHAASDSPSSSSLGELADLAGVSGPVSRLPRALDRAERARAFLADQERTLADARSRRERLATSLRQRRDAMRAGHEARAGAEATMAAAADKLASQRALAAQARDSIRGQRRRICVDLAGIFPIEPDPHPDSPPFSFRICGLPLPNATDGGVEGGDGSGADAEGGTGGVLFSTAVLRELGGAAAEDVLSAALGAVAMLVDELQYYLGVPLPYPVTAVGSRSTVRDDISLFGQSAPGGSTSPAAGASASSRRTSSAPGPRQRDFPLHLPRGGSTAAHFRFDYGWFLLNKNIETLCVSQGLRVFDMRHTLPNLKYLLYVGGAGTDELPQRKRGGVRGLWASTVKARAGVGGGDGGSSAAGSEGTSRRDSTDSEVVGKHAETLRGLVRIGEDGGGENIGKSRRLHGVDDGGVERGDGEADGETDGETDGDRVGYRDGGGVGDEVENGDSTRAGSGIAAGKPRFDEFANMITLRTKGLREDVAKVG